MGIDQIWMSSAGNKIHSQGKIPSIQKYFCNLWCLKTKRPVEDFNCQELEITNEILNDLEIKTKNKELDISDSPFFSGKHQEWHYIDIETAIRKAREEMNLGNKIYYSCWY